MADYLTVKNESSFTLIEKKSRFIGQIKPCKTEDEAIEFINSVKKKYSDARHNVYAYVLRENNKQRYSDDGEPQGTGGVPVLEVLLKRGITDVCVVVTRYFGGTLLGTGGLTRAYSESCKGAVDNSTVITMSECKCFIIECDYGFYNTLLNVFQKFNLNIEQNDFGENIKLVCNIKSSEYEKFLKELNEKFSLKVVPKLIGEKYFGFELK